MMLWASHPENHLVLLQIHHKHPADHQSLEKPRAGVSCPPSPQLPERRRWDMPQATTTRAIRPLHLLDQATSEVVQLNIPRTSQRASTLPQTTPTVITSRPPHPPDKARSTLHLAVQTNPPNCRSTPWVPQHLELEQRMRLIVILITTIIITPRTCLARSVAMLALMATALASPALLPRIDNRTEGQSLSWWTGGRTTRM